jgi:hypothetical protein
MCNLYSITRAQEAMRRLFRVHRDLLGNFPGLPAVFPDSMAPMQMKARQLRYIEQFKTGIGKTRTWPKSRGIEHWLLIYRAELF